MLAAIKLGFVFCARVMFAHIIKVEGLSLLGFRRKKFAALASLVISFLSWSKG